MTFRSPTTSSLPRTPLPAFLMTPAAPCACAWRPERTSSVSSPSFGTLAMRFTVAFKNVPTRSETTVPAHLPASAVFLAFSAMTSHVLKAFSRTSSESWNSRRGSRAWQVAGRNSTKSSSKDWISVAMSTSDSFISSRTVVFRPRTLSPTTTRLMSSLSSSSSSSGSGAVAPSSSAILLTCSFTSSPCLSASSFIVSLSSASVHSKRARISRAVK
mmetsp:Transcript_86459/g.186954  ORF Transcript_86459/g.186954 Transcript_86459/m.186954 type:complete len:215 (+) Transcript_86459:980-1624(+)